MDDSSPRVVWAGRNDYPELNRHADAEGQTVDELQRNCLDITRRYFLNRCGVGLGRIASFLSDDCKYRASQDIPMVEGPEAIVGLLEGFTSNATSVEFEMLDTWARGPVVVNDRIDRFVLPNRTLALPVVGVFYLVGGKIAEWTDFVFDNAL